MLCTSGCQEEEELEGITGAQEIGRIPQDGEEMELRAIRTDGQALTPNLQETCMITSFQPKVSACLLSSAVPGTG